MSMTSYGMFWNYGWNVLGLQMDGYITVRPGAYLGVNKCRAEDLKTENGQGQ